MFSEARPSSASKRTVYDVLGVENNADGASVKKAFRALALKYHPDRHKDDKDEAEIKFKEVTEAYEILKDPGKRVIYDRESRKVVNCSFTGLSRSPSALFDAMDNFFSSTGSTSPSIQNILSDIASSKRKTHSSPVLSRGASVRVTIPVSFQETVFGCSKSIEFKKLEYCIFCKGRGELTIAVVSGIGDVEEPSGVFPLRMTSTEACVHCQGSGKTLLAKAMLVEVPPGVKKGEERLYEGEGDVGDFEGTSGDLIVLIDAESHPLFKREGDDVISEVDISFTQAALGDKVNVPFLYGAMDIDIGPGIQPGEILKISDQGFYNTALKRKGNMFLKVNVRIPRVLTDQQRDLLKAFMMMERGVR